MCQIVELRSILAERDMITAAEALRRALHHIAVTLGTQWHRSSQASVPKRWLCKLSPLETCRSHGREASSTMLCSRRAAIEESSPAKRLTMN